jgi:hypothetical protein
MRQCGEMLNNDLTNYCNLQYAEMHTQKYFSSVKLESTLLCEG